MILPKTRKIQIAILGVLLVAVSTQAQTVTFGSGPNQFNMEFVTIGSPGNSADTTGNPNPAGAVSYIYQMSKYEVSEDMINKFNASQALVLATNGRGNNKPATYVSWNNAARFVNWLNTSTGGFPAYKFTTTGVNDNIALWTPADTLDYNAANPFRSLRATYVLPTDDEWYKAAYFNPATSTYFDYPNGLDTPPSAVASGTATNTAVYNGQAVPADITQAGGLSPFGVMGLGGNVWEWEETEFDLVNDNGATNRGFRGGDWQDSDTMFFMTSYLLSSSVRHSIAPSFGHDRIGFRVASVTPVPEPSTWVLIFTSTIGLFAYAVRAKRNTSITHGLKRLG
jgi:formylglycine-generating enzyme